MGNKLVLGAEAQKGPGIGNISHLGRQEGVAEVCIRNNQTPTVPLAYSVRQLPSFPPASVEARDLFSRVTETGRVGLRAELVSMRHCAPDTGGSGGSY